ncbi:MAG: gliding motility lipoprotein GldH [Cytophagales bacterium]|nr:gliding motility lipoprotein GldH [Bernardetiaceae bacterium]MDW8204142.1 gliding motility lipoprotein GldH [Cytophagales bacterium]
MKRSVLLIACFTALLACSDAVFKQKQDLPQSQWLRNQPLTFRFEIKDHIPAYQISCAVRYSPAYPFYNLYLQSELKDEAGNSLQKTLKEGNLFEPETGEPLGNGIGDWYEQEWVLVPSYRFAANGKYELSIGQYMRPDTLPAIASVSIVIRPLSEE